MISMRHALWFAAGAAAFGLLPGCEEDTSADSKDEVVLSVDGEEDRVIQEEGADNFFGRDPIIYSLYIAPSGSTQLRALGMSVGYGATADEDGVVLMEMAVGYAEDSVGVPTYSEEILSMALPAGEGSYDVSDTDNVLVVYQSETAGTFLSGDTASGSIDLTNYPDEGGRIKGEFSMTIDEAFVSPAATVELEGSFSVKREQDDFDVYCPDPPNSGTTHYIQTVADSSGAETDTQILVYDADEELICLDDDGGSGDFSSLELKLDSGDTYFVKVAGSNTSTSGAYSIRISTSDFDDTASTGTGSAGSEPDNDDSAGAEEITVDGADLDRTLDAAGGDIDWYQFTAE